MCTLTHVFKPTETYKLLAGARGTPYSINDLQTTHRRVSRVWPLLIFPHTHTLGKWRQTGGSLAAQTQLLSKFQTKVKSCFKIGGWQSWARYWRLTSDLHMHAHVHLLMEKRKGTDQAGGYSSKPGVYASKPCCILTQEKNPQYFFSAKNQLEQLNVKELGRWCARCCLTDSYLKKKNQT